MAAHGAIRYSDSEMSKVEVLRDHEDHVHALTIE
jgi:hypothetical protein